jgi:short-subunit dehydrogenase
MIDSKYGKIIHISSAGAQSNTTRLAPYICIKKAIQTLTIIQSKEISQYGININSISQTL